MPREAAIVSGLDVFGVKTLREAIDFITDAKPIEPTLVDTREEFFRERTRYDVDFSDVRGQENIKRAMTIAAAGGHKRDPHRPTRCRQDYAGPAATHHFAPRSTSAKLWRLPKFIP